jgi:mRNA-degrading endonuclease RelE of RelBE toxin-antitoxin system
MEYIESPLFSKLIASYMNHDEYLAFQWELALNPEKGDLIPGSGGLRKIRWFGSGRGKRGGTRIIYYYQRDDGQIWLLTIYEEVDIPAHLLKEIRKEIDR